MGFVEHPENINKKGRPIIARRIEKVKCLCGCDELFNKFDNRNRIRKYKKSHQAIKGLCRKGTNTSDQARKNLEENSLKGRIKQANMKEPTSIEKKVYEYLKLKGFIFEKQKVIGNRFIVDAYIPSMNLVIEADGIYWHSTPRGIETDKRKNDYIKTKGFSLLRLSEQEINDGSFINKLN